MGNVFFELSIAVLVALSGGFMAGLISPRTVWLKNQSRWYVLKKGIIFVIASIFSIAIYTHYFPQGEADLSSVGALAFMISFIVSWAWPLWAIVDLVKQYRRKQKTASAELVNSDTSSDLDGAPTQSELKKIKTTSSAMAKRKEHRTPKSERNRDRVEEKKRVKEDDILDMELDALLEDVDESYLEDEVLMDYVGHDGHTTHRKVRYKSTDDHLFYAYCYLRSEVRSFRFDKIKNLTNVDFKYISVDDWIEHRTGRRYESRPPSSYKSNKNSHEILFSGFSKLEREEMEDLAKGHGFMVRKSVTKNLDFLVCGPRVGAIKVQKAEEQGVMILREEQFDALIETGELVDEI